MYTPIMDYDILSEFINRYKHFLDIFPKDIMILILSYNSYWYTKKRMVAQKYVTNTHLRRVRWGYGLPGYIKGFVINNFIRHGTWFKMLDMTGEGIEDVVVIKYTYCLGKKEDDEVHYVFDYKTRNFTPVKHIDYLNGKKNGDVKMYYRNGSLKYTGKYRDNKPVGLWYGYLRHGWFNHLIDYDNKRFTTWYPTGEISKQAYMGMGGMRGDTRQWKKNGLSKYYNKPSVLLFPIDSSVAECGFNTQLSTDGLKQRYEEKRGENTIFNVLFRYLH